MKEALIASIVDIIKDYRSEDLDLFYDYKIDHDHVNKWIEQFEEKDREFILSELLHLLPSTYITKDKAVYVLSNFDIYKSDLNYKTIENFLDETIFLDCQAEGKSQKILNSIIDNSLYNKYNYRINDCGKKRVKNWFYVDDVLASGGTFRNDIINKINEYGINNFKRDNIKIIAPFIILHQWGRDNSKITIEKSLSIKLNINFYCVEFIKNNPRINQFNNNPTFNHVYPLQSSTGIDTLNFIEEAYERTYDLRNSEFAFRNPKFPIQEEFFSNPENRIRYEDILLEKGLEIMKRVDALNASSLRPLGMTPPSFKTLGTGSHFITWRNISNTCPIIFWWEANGWHPLFARKH